MPVEEGCRLNVDCSRHSTLGRQFSRLLFPRVSVIIPTFNRAALLEATLASVRAQTFRDFEIIVVDDGSSDDTPRDLANAHPQIIYRRIEHAGAGAARNVGLQIARGELIAFLDSDDEWEARFLEKMVNALDAQLRAGFAYCDYSTFDARGNTRTAYLQPHEKIRAGEAKNIFAALLAEDFLCTGTLLIRRASLAAAGEFDVNLFPVEDWELWLRLARASEAACVDESLARIRLDSAHASRDPAVVYSKNLQVLAKLQREFPADARRYAHLLRRQTARFHRALSAYYRAQHQPVPALKHACQMFAARLT